jgi:hypothetical protein
MAQVTDLLESQVSRLAWVRILNGTESGRRLCCWPASCELVYWSRISSPNNVLEGEVLYAFQRGLSPETIAKASAATLRAFALRRQKDSNSPDIASPRSQSAAASERLAFTKTLFRTVGLRSIKHQIMPPRVQLLSRASAATTRAPYQPLAPFLYPVLQQQRTASILSELSDNKGAYNKRIRVGRGPSSGYGKTSGRGHKGQKQHGKVPAGFNGGQTPDWVVKGTRGFKQQ